MKKVGLIFAVCLLIASCGAINKLETTDVEKVSYSIKYAMENTNTDKLQTDTLRVNVIIWDGDTLTRTVSSD